MRTRKTLKLIGLALVVATIGLAGAIALAQSGGEADSARARASRAAQALADAHQGNRAVAVLAEMAVREIDRAGEERPEAVDATCLAFATNAEEHLLTENKSPAEAQQLLATLVQGLRRGGGSAAAPGPMPVPAGDTNEVVGVGRDVVVAAGTTVDKASAVWGDLTVRGHVLGDAVAVMGDVTLEPGARVDGDVVSIGGRVDVSNGAWIGGDRTQLGPGAITRAMPFATSPRAAHGLGVLHWIGETIKTVGMAIVLTLLGIVIAALWPARVRNVISTMKRRPGMSVLAGVLALLATVTASLLLGITFIGIPISVALLIALGCAVMLGVTGVSCLVGEALPGKAGRTAMRCLVIGFVVLTVVSFLPFGSLLILLAVSIGLGAVVLSRVGGLSPAA